MRLEPVFPEYYLLDVAAPYGFVASGFVGSTGPLTATFRYGSETQSLPMAKGRALAPFDYGDAATVVEADIFSAGSLQQTLTRSLQKLPLPPWAEPATAWSSVPGVTYSTSLDWPISLATSRTLAGASILTGLWGISGTAASEMRVNASSQGTATPGTLEGRVNFQAAGKAFDFTLGGSHAATLNASGLSLAGNCETSPFTVPLLETNITPLSLVPGLQSAVSAVHPFFQRLIRGTGLGLRSRLSLSASGGYAASALDTAPAFTSGGIVGAVDVSARLHILPEMFRDFLYLGVEGGGGLESNIQLAPTVEMTSLGGHLYFSSTASLFGLNAQVNHDYTFGDPVAPAAVSLLAMNSSRASVASEPETAAAMLSSEEILPAGTNISVMMDDVLYSTDPAVVVASIPTSGQPAPASQIILRKVNRTTNSADHWTGFQLTNSFFANLAPTIGKARLTTPTGTRRKEVQAIVWSYSTTQAVATPADREAFANGMELRFQEFNSFENTLVGAQLGMTANSLCDFGAKIPQVSRTEPVRLFWARSHGTDFTGATTPLTLHSRTWKFRNAADGLDDGWSPEVQTLGGLSHIIDWKPFTIGLTDAVIVITKDSDGNYETLDDSELWLVRETGGVWAAPVQITNNAIPDEQPVMFQSGAALRMAWRQGGQIVYLPDVLTDFTAQVLLPASVPVGPGFARAVFGKQDALEGGDLVIAWPDSGGITYAIGNPSAPVPGGLMGTPRHAPLNDDTITGFAATIRYQTGITYLEPVSLTTTATAGSPTNIPATTDSRLSHELSPIPLSDSARSNFRILTPQGTQTVSAGGEIRLHVAVEQRTGTALQWLLNGKAIPGATSGIYHKPAASNADEGSYALKITDVSGTFEVPVAVITIAETFAAWAQDHGLVSPHNTRESDADFDGVPNDLEYLFGTNPKVGSSLPKTIYQPGEIGDYGPTVDNFTFEVRAAATDCDYAIEHSRDLLTWSDLRDEQSFQVDGSLTQTIASSPSGTYLRYLVLIENASSDSALLGQPSFARVRMIRP